MKNKLMKFLAFLILLPSVAFAQAGADCWTGGLMLGNNKYLCAYSANGQSNVKILKADSSGNIELAVGALESPTDLVITVDSDAQRLYTLGASSDTAFTLSWGDAGTTATQILTIKSDTVDGDDDATLVLGYLSSESARGAGITIPGEEVSGGSDLQYSVGSGDTHLFYVAGAGEITIDANALYPASVAGNQLGDVTSPFKAVIQGAVAIDSDVTAVTGAAVGYTGALNNSSTADNMALIGNGANTVGPNIKLFKTRANTTDANTVITTGDDLGSITAFGAASGGSYRPGGAIVFDSEGTIGASAVPGIFRILTADAAGDNLVRWNINSSGVLSNDGTSGGNINLTKSGTSLAIQEGTAASACMGTATANGVTAVTVSTTCALTASRIFISRTSAVAGGVTEPGCWATNIVNATSFDLDCNDAAEDSTFNWIIFQEAA